MTDTIFALSSGALPSGVAVVRLSGAEAFSACRLLVGSVPPPRTASLKTICQRNGEFLDRGLVVAFAAPASFTGEDCIEFQLHGGRAVVAKLLNELGAISGLRQADAGEFSRRAFENGKLDLVEIEGLADLIAAETEMQRRLASEDMGGHRSALYTRWADRLTHARAMIEADLDFPDEDDVPGSVADSVWIDMSGLSAEMASHLDHGNIAELIRDGLKVVISGAPNVGKSTLINRLAARDVAIVTDIPGTTRDILHVDVDMDGFAVKLYDTAGLRASDDPIEMIGVERARAMLDQADIILALSIVGLDSDTEHFPRETNVIRVGTQLDRYPRVEDSHPYDIVISAKTGEGVDQLCQLILQEMKTSTDAGFSFPSRSRHRTRLMAAKQLLDETLSAVDMPLDIRAEGLRLAATELGRITGRVHVEQLLDVIFSNFCIGK